MVNHHNQDFLKVIFLDFVKVFLAQLPPEILLVSMTWENSPLLPAVFDWLQVLSTTTSRWRWGNAMAAIYGCVACSGLRWFRTSDPARSHPEQLPAVYRGKWGCTVKVGIREELGHKLIRCPERVVRPEARETKNEKTLLLGEVSHCDYYFSDGLKPPTRLHIPTGC